MSKDYDRKYHYSDVTFTLTGLAQALDYNKARGIICDWWHDEHTHGNSGTREFPLYWVVMADRERLPLATPWEAHVFLCGIESAREAAKRGKELS